MGPWSRTFEVGRCELEKQKHPSDRDGVMVFPVQDKWAEVLSWLAQVMDRPSAVYSF
jgi:hypothetical protein